MDSHRFEETFGVHGEARSWVGLGRPLDVVFVGANLTNLASAVALTSTFEEIRVKVYDAAESLQHVDDMLLTLSPQAWKALSDISTITTKNLLHQRLVHQWSLQGELQDQLWTCGVDVDTELCGRLKPLLELLGSLLPDGAVCLGKKVNKLLETAEGVKLELEGEETVFTKLVVSPFGGVQSNITASPSSTGFIQAEILLRPHQQLPTRVSKWRNGDSIAVCRPLDSGDCAVSCLLPHSFSRVDGNLGRLLELLREFPAMGEALPDGPEVSSWVVKDIIRPDAQTMCNRGRVTFIGGASEKMPFLAPQKAERAFADALLLRCSLSEKGLTPAALRDVERLRQENNSRIVAEEWSARSPDWLRFWGLSKTKTNSVGERSQPPGVSYKPTLPPCDVALAKGLKSAMPKSGMGWRIVS